MADPRAVIDYGEMHAEYTPSTIDASTITYDATLARGSAMVDLAVELVDDRTVALAEDGKAVYGRLQSVEADGFCSVQTGGYTKLPAGTGASLTFGKAIVGALLSSARGYIREVATGTAGELGLCRGRIVDNDDTTAVIVDLD
jgi:hypothetical protein